MELYAAVDLMGGEAVRLVQGDFARATRFGDPRALVEGYLDAGVPWVHVVDLDAARTGAPTNRATVRALAQAAHDAGARVQVGGGVRTDVDVDAVLDTGADRVVLGTAAVESPAFALDAAAAHPGAVAVGLDYRRRTDGTMEPAVRGWTEGSGMRLEDLLAHWRAAPLGAVVVTAIARDGTGEGPDTEGLAQVLDATDAAVVASGGVGSVRDLSALGALRARGSGRGLTGAVVGRALVDGTMSAREAMAACAAFG